jgi:1-aminocyclopropane-1-carboxylate deaminase
MQAINSANITIDKILLPAIQKKGVELNVLRLDKIHTVVSGNKWFKLRFYLDEALQLNKKIIVTFGGAWSNHIVATAAACKLKGLSAIGIIRGEEPANYSATLVQAVALGMQLYFISREDYMAKNIPAAIITNDTYFIAEGGYGKIGAAGAATILNNCQPGNYSHICCAAGTGTMAAGIINSLASHQQLVAFSALKGFTGLKNNISQLLVSTGKQFETILDYHFGGYARHQPALLTFMNEFYEQTDIPTDFVYTGKLFYGLLDLIEKGFFFPGSKILAVHSGGLQGNQSLNNGKLIF